VKERIRRLAGNLSLRRLLLSSSIIQLLLVAAFLGLMFVRASRESVDALSLRLGSEVAARITEHLESFMAVPLLVNSINSEALLSGRVNLSSPKSWQPFFSERISSFPTIAYAFIGTPSGEFFGARRFLGEIEVFFASPEKTGGASVYYSIGREGTAEKQTVSYSGFDPRTRPWYVAGEHAEGPVWSDIYRHFALEDLAITAVQPLRRDDGTLVGVLGVDLPLSKINEFLRKLKVGAEGQIFILDGDGRIVADSTIDRSFDVRKGVFQRISGVESQNSAIRRAAEKLELGGSGDSNDSSFIVDSPEGPQYVRTLPFRSFGLDWRVAVVIPEEEFIAPVRRMMRSALVITLIALLVALGAGVWTSRWICRPLAELVNSARAIACGEWKTPVVLDRADEVGELSRSFSAMAVQLSDAFSGLEEKVRSRTEELEQKNRELAEAKIASEILAEEAKAASRAKSAFLASMSHEIRTPMNAVLGLTDLVLATPLSEEQREYLSLAQSSAESLLGLLDDILDLAKIEAGKMSLEQQPFLLRPLVDQVVALLQPKARKKGLSLTASVERDLPDTFVGDSLRIRQILLNLAGNAVKFTSEGSVAIEVSVIGKEADRYLLECAVTDTGPGIAPENTELLFNDFTQLDASPTRRYGGTGLGLSISRDFALLMSGDITVESCVGRGSTFRFRLPLSPYSGEVGEDTSPAEVPFFFKPGRILLVEDNEVNTRMASAMLKKTGLAVHHASNGQEAVDLWRKECFDMILMDCEMPVMDGFEAARIIRSEEGAGSVPIVALTAYAMKGDRERCLEAGMTDYLPKPIRARSLYAMLARYLDESEGLFPEAASFPDPGTEQHENERERWRHALAELKHSLDDDEDALSEMKAAFLQEAPELRRTIGESLKKNDLSEAARSFHKLKGILGYMAGSNGGELVRTLENAARSGILTACEPMLAELDAFLQRYLDFLGMDGPSVR